MPSVFIDIEFRSCDNNHLMKIRLHLTKRCSHVLYVIVTQYLPLRQNRPRTKNLPRHIRRGHYSPKTME